MHSSVKETMGQESEGAEHKVREQESRRRKEKTKEEGTSSNNFHAIHLFPVNVKDSDFDEPKLH